jgi:CRP-like cAMP-binding protein
LYSDSASTIEDCEITFIPKEVFQRVLQDSPEIPLRLLKALAHEFRLFKIGIAILATSSVKERLATNLLILDEKFRKSQRASKGSEIVLSRSDLANMVGTAKENLVRMLAEFKANGLIKITTDGIQIIDRNGLIKAASLIGRI